MQQGCTKACGVTSHPQTHQFLKREIRLYVWQLHLYWVEFIGTRIQTERKTTMQSQSTVLASYQRDGVS